MPPIASPLLPVPPNCWWEATIRVTSSKRLSNSNPLITRFRYAITEGISELGDYGGGFVKSPGFGSVKNLGLVRDQDRIEPLPNCSYGAAARGRTVPRAAVY